MNPNFIQELYRKHEAVKCYPNKGQVGDVIEALLGLLFPQHTSHQYAIIVDFEAALLAVKAQLEQYTAAFINGSSKAVMETFYNDLPRLVGELEADAEAMLYGDPAAKTTQEVIACYPGFFAIALYRIAHRLHLLDIPLMPRLITEHAHAKTGIDIHPAASIGHHFFIDHGTGVVIGETAIIGNYVKLYQGVTLGALSINKNLAAKKRHPTIENHVVIYAGATILGGKTVVGHNSTIGGNVWLTHSVTPFSKLYYNESFALETKKHKTLTHE